MKTEVRYHPYQEDPDLPGTCRCGLLPANRRHQMPDLREATTESRRRAGEGDDE